MTVVMPWPFVSDLPWVYISDNLILSQVMAGVPLSLGCAVHGLPSSQVVWRGGPVEGPPPDLCLDVVDLAVECHVVPGCGYYDAHDGTRPRIVYNIGRRAACECQS